MREHVSKDLKAVREHAIQGSGELVFQKERKTCKMHVDSVQETARRPVCAEG